MSLLEYNWFIKNTYIYLLLYKTILSNYIIDMISDMI